jgi:hypothetical protein
MPIIQASEVVNGGIVRPVPTTARFDSMLLSTHIQSAELKFIKPDLCAAFYEDLIAQKNPVPSNYNPDVGPIVLAYPGNADYEALWTSYLLALDSYAVFYIALPFIAVQTGTNGLYLNDSQFGEQAGTRGAKYLQDAVLDNHIEPLREAMLDFLCDNAANYPLFPVDIKCKSCSCSCANGQCQDLTTCRKKGPISKKLGIFLY